MKWIHWLTAITLVSGCQLSSDNKFGLIIRNGMIYDGNGKKPYKGDIAINADTIAYVGDLSGAYARNVIDAKGMAIAPGFINMLSWANESLIQDGRSQGDIKQGITLEVMGEGESMGPLSPSMKNEMEQYQTAVKYKVEWTTLGEYLNYLQKKGVSCNVASFVGATTVRRYIIGEDNREPSPAELDSMRQLVAQSMKEGALGVGSSLIYPPAFFAKTDELVALCEEAARYGGSYISHMRSEGTQLYEALEELITIARRAHIHAEVYHLKAAGKSNWTKIDSVIRRIERARAEGLDITANMYNYIAGGTGLTACLPPSLQDGGFGKLRSRLHDPAIRKQTIRDMNTPATTWENFYAAAGSPDRILLVGFRQDSLKKYIGKSLGEIARLRNRQPDETALDLILEDSSRIESIYFLMDEANIKKQQQIPWMSFGSDEGSYTPEGVFLQFNCHPRAYGNFARLLGKYVRDEKVMPLEEAIRKLTKLPATNLRIERRGVLKEGNYADVVVFDPAAIQDHATFDKPHQFATGVTHVLVNGVVVLKDGEHTGAKPGRFVKGAGFNKQ
ncbi:N-acyl-D-amino-acid deacylase family protein [Niastella populi]|uniref:Aminoacylase n=1 Tax=Niastella populi TaxID=550983 RepID=A0A1V9FGL1_9BACT|nr:D-aminoacylase [Niastella populi]OQP57509.1 aminoacylase [Niastella populi]